MTEQKILEGKLIQEASKFATLLETTIDGVHILDENGQLVEFNRSFAMMLGYAPEEMQNLNVLDWDAQQSPNDIIQIFSS